jgi:hypothetical protein
MTSSFVVVETPALTGADAAIAPLRVASILPGRGAPDKGPRGPSGPAAYSPAMLAAVAVPLGAAAERMDPTWPPVLVAAVVTLGVLAIVGVAVMFRRLRAAAREQRLRPQGWQR